MTESASGMKVSFAENLQSALPAVIEYLSAPAGGDIFAPENIIVPNAGVRAWLLQQIASSIGVSDGGSDGVAANISVQYLGAIDGFLGKNYADEDPWAVGPLSLSVLSVISRHSGSFTPHIERMGGGLKAARLMADRFDKYQARRPGMIVQWNLGNAALSPEVGANNEVSAPVLSPEDQWQFDLWRLVREEIDTDPWPVVVEDMFTHPEKLDDLKLPHKLLVVGLQSLGVRHLRALQLLSQRIQVEVVLVHPSPALQTKWNSLASQVSVSPGVAPTSVRQKTMDTTVDPLVGMWLRGAHDAHMLLASQGVAAELSPAVSEVIPTSVLEAVQETVRRGVVVPVNFSPDAHDPSFIVHRAHNLSRQIEILHEELLHAFATIEGLQPHDVVIMCADIEKAAPLLEATFRKKVSHDGGKTHVQLPFIVADRGLRHVDDGAMLLSNLLSVVLGRFSISDVMSIATSELVMKKVGANAGDVAAWQNIVDRTAVRWGASSEHRAHLGVQAPSGAHTWLQGIQRSLVGAILPDAFPNADFGGTVPLAGLDTADIDSISRLSRIVSVLSAFESEIFSVPNRTLVEWAEAVQDMLINIAPNEKGELDDALEAINTLRQFVSAAKGENVAELKVTFQHFAEQLDEQLSSAPGRQPLRTGAITSTSVVPLRGVPFKVVCLVGFDEGTMQAGDAEGDDLLSRQEFMGDSNPRIDQRRGILDAVCAASHRFVLTCNGRSIKNNEEVPLITPLAELVDLTVRCGVTETRAKGYADIEYVHPRHFSSAKNFVAGEIVPSRVFSHDKNVLSAVSSGSAQTELAKQSAGFVLAGDEEQSHLILEPQVLERFIRDPLSAFVRRSLRINTWNDAEVEEPAVLPLSLSKSQITGLMSDSLIAQLSKVPRTHWVKLHTEVGDFPVGAYGEADQKLITSQTDKMVALAEQWGADLATVKSYPVHIPFQNGELVGSLNVHPAEGNRICLINMDPRAGETARSAQLRFTLALYQLFLRASGHDVSGGVALRWTTTGAAKTDTMGAQYVLLDSEISQTEAIERVQQLCDLFVAASHEPFPMFGKTAEKFVASDDDGARKEFSTYLNKNNTTKEGKSFTYLTTLECLLYGTAPHFSDIYEMHNHVYEYFQEFFGALVGENKQLHVDPNDPSASIPAQKPQKKISPVNSGDSVTGYVYS